MDSNKTTLGMMTAGSKIILARREYIVLEQLDGVTAIILKNSLPDRQFGSDNQYRTSSIRKYLNAEYIKEVQEFVRSEDIVRHKVDLRAEDGTNKGAFCFDEVSLLTADNYRKYREYLEPIGKIWWMATPVSTHPDYARDVCYVSSDGILGWGGSVRTCGVRPFLTLSSSISNFEPVNG